MLQESRRDMNPTDPYSSSPTFPAPFAGRTAKSERSLDSDEMRDDMLPVRVLLVEDDETIAAGLSLFLEEAGYAVEWSPSGVGIAERVCSNPPDLLILDVQLGDADGREIYRAVRHAQIDVPVIIMSGSHTITENELDRSSAFLPKPFEMSEFLRVVASLNVPLA